MCIVQCAQSKDRAQTKLSLAGIIKLFPARDSLVSDIPAGDGKNDYLCYSVYFFTAIYKKQRFLYVRGETDLRYTLVHSQTKPFGSTPPIC